MSCGFLPTNVPQSMSRRETAQPAITTAMMRAGRDAVQGSPRRSDRVRRTRLARVHCTCDCEGLVGGRETLTAPTSGACPWHLRDGR